MNSENEIKHRLLDVCKVKGWDSDINIVGFHALCDELKALGAEEEREACAKVCEDLYKKWVDDLVNDTDDTADSGTPDCVDCKLAIRARGNI